MTLASGELALSPSGSPPKQAMKNPVDSGSESPRAVAGGIAFQMVLFRNAVMQ